MSVFKDSGFFLNSLVFLLWFSGYLKLRNYTYKNKLTIKMCEGTPVMELSLFLSLRHGNQNQTLKTMLRFSELQSTGLITD